MGNNQLPIGWVDTTLDKIGEIVSGGTPSTKTTNNFGGYIAWITPSDLTGYGEKYIKHGKRNITLKGLKNSSARIVPKNSILFSSRAPIGYTVIAANRLCTNQGFKNLIPCVAYINSEYVYYYLKNSKNIAESFASGTTFKEISGSKFKKLPIKLPPLNEQKRILTKIEKLFSNLDKSDQHLAHLEKQLKRYRQSVLKSAFEGELTREWREKQTDLESADELLEKIKSERIEYIEQEVRKKFKDKTEKWIIDKVKKENSKIQKSYLPFSKELSPSTMPIKWLWANIESLVSFEKNAMKAGPFGSSLKKSFHIKSGYKIYGQEQVIAGDPFLGNYYVDETKYEELITCKVQPKDALISLVGTIGKVLILPHNTEEGVINPRLIKLSFHKKYYLPEFFKYYFESSFLKSIYKIDAHGATMDIINMSIIKKLPFPLCSLREQEEVIQQIDKHMSIIDKLETVVQKSIKESKRLRQSILKQAFEGKLVKQDPNDESAEILLEKIAKAKEEYKKQMKKGKKK